MGAGILFLPINIGIGGFGRYGGYGAGFATGLLGFLQVYWDPNRQAIQDKISATVVIQGSVNQAVNVQTVEEAVKS